jgi:nitroreductase
MLEDIKKRRSIRRYTSEPVADDDVRALLEAAMAAPSADNLQPWEFIVVDQRDLRQKLAETHPWSSMCAGAPVVIVVCANHRRSKHWVEDASAATENLLLCAAARDLGTVWVGLYPNQGSEKHVRDTLGIPSALRVLCMVPVGHPAEQRAPGTKFDESKVHYNGY